MRHQLSGRKLNRTKAHRQALFSNMSVSLLTHEQIKTTLPKAKELRPIVEKLITMGKDGSLHKRRQLISMLKDAGVADKVITTLADRYKDRQGGYIRILKAGFRYGDAAPMAIIELVDRQIMRPAVVDIEGSSEEVTVKAEKVLAKKTKAKSSDKSTVRSSGKSSIKETGKKTTAQRKPSI